MNADLYPFVVLTPLFLQGSQALTITVPGGEQYKIPTAIIALNFDGGTSTPTLVSDLPVAIVGADNFVGSDVMVKNLFDTVTGDAREVAPTCNFLSDNAFLVQPLKTRYG